MAEWTTMSAPSSSGRCSSGVAKVLSTTRYAPAAWAAAAIAGMSATSSAGLVGDSTHTSAAPSQAATTAAVSSRSTSRLTARPRDSRSASCITLPW